MSVKRAVLIVAVEGRSSDLRRPSAADQSLLLTSRMSSQPSPSASKKAHAGAQRLGQVLLAGPAAVVGEPDAGRGGDVGECQRLGGLACAAGALAKAGRLGAWELPSAPARTNGRKRNSCDRSLRRRPRALAGDGCSGTRLVLVDRLALVVVLGASACGGVAVIACDDSSALKRRKSFSSRAAFSSSPRARQQSMAV